MTRVEQMGSRPSKTQHLRDRQEAIMSEGCVLRLSSHGWRGWVTGDKEAAESSACVLMHRADGSDVNRAHAHAQAQAGGRVVYPRWAEGQSTPFLSISLPVALGPWPSVQERVSEFASGCPCRLRCVFRWCPSLSQVPSGSCQRLRAPALLCQVETLFPVARARPRWTAPLRYASTHTVTTTAAAVRRLTPDTRRSSSHCMRRRRRCPSRMSLKTLPRCHRHCRRPRTCTKT